MFVVKNRVAVFLIILAWLSLLGRPCYAGSPFGGLRAIWVGMMGTTKNHPTTTLPIPKDEQWWHEVHNKNIDKAQAHQDASLIFLGDSITQNMDSAQDLLEKNWSKRDPLNLGIGGDQTEHLIWRVEHGEVDGLKPRLSVILIGTNNLGTNTDTEIAEGVRAVVTAVRSKLPRSRVLVLGLLPRGRQSADPLRLRIKNINNAIAHLSDQRHVWYADIGYRLVESDGSMSETVMPDYLHPSHHGYDLFFTAIKPQVDKLLQP